MAKSWGAAIAAVALLAMPADAACWNAAEASAATVRQLQSMMMVATLRCHAAGHDIAADYNGFLQANKAALIRMNDRLKAHFIRTAGAVGGQRAYDGFTTSMANGYGAAASSPDVCASMGSLIREAGLMAGSVEGLVMLAEREAVAAAMPEGRCDTPVTMASASATRGIIAAVQPNSTPAIAASTGQPSAAIRAVVGTAPVEASLAIIPGH